MELAAELQVTAGWRRRLAKGRGRWFGIAASIAVTAALLLPDPGPLPPLRFASFDTYQLVFPRIRRSNDVVVVEIDNDTLSEMREQWPWPRDRFAVLIDAIAARKPKVIAIDILFSEPDRASPERMALAVQGRDPIAAAHLAKLQPNDDILAGSIARAPVVMGAAGLWNANKTGPRFAPARVTQPAPPLKQFSGVLSSISQIDTAALGHGLLDVEPEHGIVRRVPVVAYVGEAPALAFAAEIVRVAENLPLFTLKLESGLTRVGLGEHEVTAQPDGYVWLHFAEPDERRKISAARVLNGKETMDELRDKIVLVGVTALALLDHHTTARGDHTPGIDIHAQMVETILEGSELRRPSWTRLLEALALACAATVIVIYTPRVRPRRSFMLVIVCAAVLIAIGVAAFLGARVLVDAATPIAGAAVLYAVMLAGTLVATQIERRELAARLHLQREAAARAAGELEAARRIQTGILPTRETALVQERRIDIFTHMHPAREVGGDLYDFYLLPDQRFLLLQGDVSGKGLGAAMFMAVSKAVAKSCALRERSNVADMMTTFNREIARENPEQMFVTMAAIIIDLASGEVEYCNAGHEPPLLLRRTGEPIVLDDAGGPPLCVVDDFVYDQARAQLEPRDLLILASDGITEAMNRDGQVYGRDRLKALLQSPERRNLDLSILGNEILASVKTFEGAAEPSDDQTLVLVVWRGR